MTNTGWQLIQLEEGEPLVSGETHHLMKREDGGTIKEEDSSIREVVRLSRTATKIHEMIPPVEAVIIEDALKVGQSRSPTGLALLALILHPFIHKQKHPNLKYVVTITPERLQSLAHKERSTPGSVVVKKYRALVEKYRGEKVPRPTHHEADSYFLAYHGVRFIRTALETTWETKILDAQEKRIFFEATADVKKRVKGKKGLQKTGEIRSTAMKDLEGTAWWRTG